MSKLPILIIGAGPAGLMAAEQLAKKGFVVRIYEQNKAAARKFLVAGHGGFNLTHNEPLESFIEKYDQPAVQQMVRHFDNQATRAWLADIGIETYVGSSGKVFPIKTIKPIMVLQAWLKRLDELGVEIYYDYRLLDFDNEKVLLEHKGNTESFAFSHLILGLGGGSWAKTGSNAQWVELFGAKNIPMHNLQPANSGFNTAFDTQPLAGQYLKNVRVHFQDYSKLGELVFTDYGMEGSAVYYLNRYIRQSSFPSYILLDLKPEFSLDHIYKSLSSSHKTTDILKRSLKIQAPALGLLKSLDKETYLDPSSLAKMIKAFPIKITGFRPIDEVISTAGGVSFEGLNMDLSLKAFPKVYCIGEMLDWEAPTGGYLLQACFSMGYWVATGIE